MFQELAGEAGIWPEQQRMLSAYHPSIQVWHRHGRRSVRGFSINLRMMALVDGGVVATQPDAADGKAAISLALRNAGFLKQRQGAPAPSDKDELGRHRSPIAALGIRDLDAPASVLLVA